MCWIWRQDSWSTVLLLSACLPLRLLYLGDAPCFWGCPASPATPSCLQIGRITISGMVLGLRVPWQWRAETSSSRTARKMFAHSVSYMALTTTATWNLQQLSVTGPDQRVVMSGTIGHMPICICKNKPWSKLWSGLQKAYYTESILPKQKEEKSMFRTWLKCSQRAWDAQKGCEIIFLESNLEMVEVTNRHRCFQ